VANYYHILIETSKANLPIGMRQLNAIYTKVSTAGINSVGASVARSFQTDSGGNGISSPELRRLYRAHPLRVKSSGRSQIGSGVGTGQELDWLPCQSF
jgi:hypothetical protein